MISACFTAVCGRSRCTFSVSESYFVVRYVVIIPADFFNPELCPGRQIPCGNLLICFQRKLCNAVYKLKSVRVIIAVMLIAGGIHIPAVIQE